MKTIQKFPMMEARTAALLTGLAVGLAIALHQFFFVVALGIVLIVIVEWTVQRVQEYLREFRLFHRYP